MTHSRNNPAWTNLFRRIYVPSSEISAIDEKPAKADTVWKGRRLMPSLKIFEGSGTDEIGRWCPLCGSYEQIARLEYSLTPWRIVACVECGFVYLANPVNYSDLVEDQAWQKNAKKEAVRRRRERPVLDRLSKGTQWRLKLFGRDKARLFLKVFGKGGVLDVGCGGGMSLLAPLVPFGVEISRHLAEIADHTMQKRGGHCVHAAAIEGIRSFENRFFDGVLLNSFLEHETNPLPLLHEVHRVLSDDGVVYVRVPNFSSINRRVMGRKWCGFRYPDHVNYFSAGSLSKMANLAGFELQILNKINLPFDDNVKAVLKKSDRTPAKLQ